MMEIAVFSIDIQSPLVTHTIAHHGWQEGPFKTPTALEDEVIDINKVHLEAAIVARARSL